ncbi:MAG: PKD domain-containing protein, partial [Microthrixaceae bacterium]
SDGTIASYEWDFGDGSPVETTADATHTYTAAGSYTAKLKVTDDGNKSTTKTVVITASTALNVPPVAVIGASATTGTAPLVVDFTGSGSTDADGTVVAHEWTFGDGSPTSTEADPNHTFTAPGAHIVTLTVTDDEGATHTASTTVTVVSNDAPVAAASATPTSGKAPLTVAFSSAGSTDADGTIVGHAWTFGDGNTSSAADPSHTFTLPGSYTATLTVTDDLGGTDSSTVIVQVNANVAPTAVANSNVTGGQAPLTVTFSSAGSADSDGGVTGHSWSFGDGNTSSSANPTYTYGTPGSYTATLTVSDAEGATGTASIELTVDAIPNVSPTAAAAATPTEVRQGLPVSFSSAGSSDSDGTISGYNWDFGDGAHATTANPTHAYNVPGTYVAVLTVTDNAGGTGTASTETITVTPNVAPTAAAAGAPGGGKAPLTVNFSSAGSSDPDGTIASYNWDFGDGSPDKTTANATHVYTAAGSYTATLTVTDDYGATDTATVQTVVVANQAPTAVLNATPQSGPRPLVVAFSSLGSADPDGTIASYAWDFGDGGTSTTANPAHTYAVGTYNATLVVTDDNGVASAPVSVVISVHIDDDGDGFQPPADCNDASAGVNPSAADPLDPSGTDTNCDGVDGVLSNTTFVAATGGADSGSCGDLATPCATVGQAVTRAAATGRTVVQAASGTYPGAFTLSGTITVRGGYAAGFASRSGTSTVNGNVTATNTASGASLVDLTINGAGGANATGVLAQNSTVALLRVTVDSGTPTGAGSSAYGLRAISGSNVTVTDSVLSAKPGVAGAAGSGVPGAAAAGCNGGRGGNASTGTGGSGAGSCGGGGVAASGAGGQGGSYSGGGASGSAGGGGAAGGAG